MFYNKEINIYVYKSYTDEHGIDREGYSKVNEEPIMVDIQPYNSEKAKKDSMSLKKFLGMMNI